MTDPVVEETRKQPHSRIGATIRRLVRARITAGLITILPILLTIWVVRLIFTSMRDASQWAVLAALETPWFQKYVWKVSLEEGVHLDGEQFLGQHPVLDWMIAIFSVAVTISILYVIGLFATNIVGRRLITAMEQLLDRVPLIKTVYRSLKQILASFTSDETQSFRRVALVPFPHEKLRCVGFITNTFKDSVTGEELCAVFIATTPNPTTGYLQIIKREDVTELNWTVEEAIRCVMSGGILKPEFLTIVPNKDLPGGLPSGVGPTNIPAPSLPGKSMVPQDD